MITWKLWQNNNPSKATIKSAPLPPEILERQARGEAIRKIAGEPHHSTEPPAPPPE